MWIPIPIVQNLRLLPEKDYVSYWRYGIEEMKSHPYYGVRAKDFIEKVGIDELLRLMVAVAKTESGGKPVGQFEFHRYEPHKDAFSYSIFHVLMVGAGLDARRHLNMTEGQTYHPKNAGKLFLAFLLEKSTDPSKYFPLLNDKKVKVKVRNRKGKKPRWTYITISSNLSEFSSFYNGKGWKKSNPKYPVNLEGYLEYADTLLDYKPKLKAASKPAPKVVAKAKPPKAESKPAPKSAPKAESKVKPTPAPKVEKPSKKVVFVRIRKRPLRGVIEDANLLSVNKFGVDRILKTDSDVSKCLARIIKFLREKYGSEIYYASDSIGLGVDEKGVFILFKRDGKKHFLRVKP
jgi:hypothetical protein